MRRLCALIFICLMLPVMAYAHTNVRSEYICPIDGTEFSALLTGSDTSRGMMLDLQPISVSVGRYPWPVAECPTDGMVMYKRDFTPEEVATLKDYVSSPEYQSMRQEDTSYWRVARLKEKLGVPLNKRWFTMLQATWQAHSKKYEVYARETIGVIETLLADPGDIEESDIETMHLVLGELYRRVGEFDQAKAIFEDLMKQPVYANHEFYPNIIAYQLELIEAKDQSSHKVPF